MYSLLSFRPNCQIQLNQVYSSPVKYCNIDVNLTWFIFQVSHFATICYDCQFNKEITLFHNKAYKKYLFYLVLNLIQQLCQWWVWAYAFEICLKPYGNSLGVHTTSPGSIDRIVEREGTPQVNLLARYNLRPVECSLPKVIGGFFIADIYWEIS